MRCTLRIHPIASLAVVLCVVHVCTALECGTPAKPCLFPACRCLSPLPPLADRPVTDLPQFVKLSFDDWLYGEGTRNLIYGASAILDARGCSPRLTAYTSMLYSSRQFAERLYRDGHEIALHTMSHNTSHLTPEDSWNLEIGEALQYLAVLKIPPQTIRGSRAPYLGFSAAMFNTLQKFGLAYDSTLFCNPSKSTNTPCPTPNSYWPFTLDYGSPLPCGAPLANTCPDPIPGLWEIPMMMLRDLRPNATLSTRSMFMDPEGPDDYPGGLLQLLKDNFDAHYTQSRMPFSLHYHEPYLTADPRRVPLLHEFFRYAAAKPHVFFVTDGQLLSWTKSPVSAEELIKQGDALLGSCRPNSR